MIQDCTAALELEPAHFKARLRRGQAHSTAGELDAALADVAACLAAQPGQADAMKIEKELRKKAKDKRAPDVFREPASAPTAGPANGATMSSGAAAPGRMPGFEEHWQAPGLWDRLKKDEGCRTHAGDPEFVRKVEEIRADPSKLRSHINDPRIVMAMTFLADGVRMSVSDTDLKNAVRKGEIKKVEPVTSLHTDAAANFDDAASCREAGNTMFREGKHAFALACYQRALELALGSQASAESGGEGRSGADAAAAAAEKGVKEEEAMFNIYANIAAAWLKLGWPPRAEAACTAALGLPAAAASAHCNVAKVCPTLCASCPFVLPPPCRVCPFVLPAPCCICPLLCNAPFVLPPPLCCLLSMGLCVCGRCYSDGRLPWRNNGAIPTRWRT